MPPSLSFAQEWAEHEKHRGPILDIIRTLSEEEVRAIKETGIAREELWRLPIFDSVAELLHTCWLCNTCTVWAHLGERIRLLDTTT